MKRENQTKAQIGRMAASACLLLCLGFLVVLGSRVPAQENPAAKSEGKQETASAKPLPTLSVEPGKQGTYLVIRLESIPDLVLDMWCYEDRLGQPVSHEKEGNAVILFHRRGEAEVKTRFEPCPDGVDIRVLVTGPTAEAVRQVRSLNPCCQMARSDSFRSRGDYVEDFVSRCFVFLEGGMTFLGDTSRVPGTRLGKDDRANLAKPWIQEYYPAWRKHPGQAEGQRGRSLDRPVYPIIGVVSRDGRHLAAIAWPESGSLGQVWHHCFHPRPQIGESFDADSGTIPTRGKVYLMENDGAELLARFRRDFPDWKRPPDAP